MTSGGTTADTAFAEIALPVPGTWDNPFDPDEVTVDATVTRPSGQRAIVPCFFTVPMARTVEGTGERWRPTAPGHWAVRVSSRERGVHAVEIRARDRAGDRVVDRRQIDLAPAGRGFVRVAEGRSFEHEDGTPVIPIGMNLGWWISRDPSVQIERVLGRMRQVGMTWGRIWLTHFGDGLGLEWHRGHPSGHYEGLGRYSMVAAARLDRILATAERLGIALQIVLWQHSQLASPSHSSWHENPYRAANGGPCAESSDFFTAAEAIRLSDARLRYLAARYGAFESLFAWEVFNEMDLVTDAPFELVSAWCSGRARALRALDGSRHPITTSQAFPASMARPIVFASDDYDVAQCHAYAPDIVQALALEAPAHAFHGKPTIVAEMGLGIGGAEDLLDTGGQHLHDATWAALMLGYAGGAMSWWWDTYVDAQDHYDRHRGAAAFCRGERLADWGACCESLRGEGSRGLRVFGRAGRTTVAWICADRDERVEGAVLVLPDGASAEAEQWDTRRGEVVSRSRVQGVVPLASFRRDTAIKVRPLTPGGT